MASRNLIQSNLLNMFASQSIQRTPTQALKESKSQPKSTSSVIVSNASVIKATPASVGKSFDEIVTSGQRRRKLQTVYTNSINLARQKPSCEIGRRSERVYPPQDGELDLACSHNISPEFTATQDHFKAVVDSNIEFSAQKGSMTTEFVEKGVPPKNCSGMNSIDGAQHEYHDIIMRDDPAEVSSSKSAVVSPPISDDIEEDFQMKEEAIVHEKMTIVNNSNEDGTKKITDKAIEISEYERERLARIQQNQAFLAQIGMSSGVSMTDGSEKRKRDRDTHREGKAKKRRKFSEKESFPTQFVERRYSLRSRSESLPSEASEAKLLSSQEASPQNGKEDLKEYKESVIFTYICGSRSLQEREGKEAADIPERPTISGFSVKREFYNEALSRAYSVAFTEKNMIDLQAKVPIIEQSGENSVPQSQDFKFIAAGGHGGMIAIYPDMGEACLAEMSDPLSALLTWKAHKGWISGVSFMRESTLPRMISTGNDGTMSIWDLGQQWEDHRAVPTPKLLESCSTLHSSGIFSLDFRSGRALTASKDGTVALSSITEGGIASLGTFYTHDRVVKCARFRDDHCYASCGNDMDIHVVDTRLPQGECLTFDIKGVHNFAMNSVEWHPRNSNLILSSSFGPELYLHDLRNPSAPLQTFKSHTYIQRAKGINTPVFFKNGEVIAIYGAGTESICLYNSESGEIISKGYIGCDVNTIAVDSTASSPTLAVTHGKSLSLLEPF